MQQQKTLFPKYETFGDIHFSTNWNKKIGCHFFTTIRLSNPKKYRLGKIYRILKNEDYLIDARIVLIEDYTLYTLPEFICYTDTGYNKTQTISMLQSMYQAKQIDWHKQLLSIILLEHLDWVKP